MKPFLLGQTLSADPESLLIASSQILWALPKFHPFQVVAYLEWTLFWTNPYHSDGCAKMFGWYHIRCLVLYPSSFVGEIPPKLHISIKSTAKSSPFSWFQLAINLAPGSLRLQLHSCPMSLILFNLGRQEDPQEISSFSQVYPPKFLTWHIRAPKYHTYTMHIHISNSKNGLPKTMAMGFHFHFRGVIKLFIKNCNLKIKN
jgi:hypothetical protein